MKNIVVLEDHPDVQQWVVKLCKRVFPDAVVVGISTVSEVHALDICKTDLMMVDLNLPDGRGDSVISYIKARKASVQCIVLTSFDDDDYLFSALKAGANGYLLKDQQEDELVAMLQGIVSDRPALSPLIALKLLNQFHTTNPLEGHRPDLNDEEIEANLLHLTPRESEVLRLIAKGYSVKESAKLMDISHHTVSGYIKEIYRKLHVNSRAEAASLATRLGLN